MHDRLEDDQGASDALLDRMFRDLEALDRPPTQLEMTWFVLACGPTLSGISFDQSFPEGEVRH